ncbi:MAG TPA: alpha/beta fold hydrolase [Clostridiales bacterium]|nr:alpha/beta fold hydrolase [Clostridiales bacterium]
MKKRTIVPILIICLLMVFSTGIAAADTDPIFTDIDNHWAKAAVTEAYSYGIIFGYEDKTFRPDNVVTRAEFAAMLDRLLKADIVNPSATNEVEIPFTDVPKTYWAYDVICDLYAQDIIHGVSATKFDPTSPILRQDMAILMQNADKVSDNLNLVADTSKNIAKFNDVGDISKYAVEGMTFAYQSGIFNGDNHNCIYPKTYAKRSETAQVFSNTIDLMKNPPLPVSLNQEEWADAKQYVDIATGAHMAYIEMGNRNGEPLVLIHGASDSSRSWSLIAPYFAKAGYHVYIPEMRGHGATATNGMARIETGMLGYEVICFLDAVGLDRVNIVGHSRGSRIAQAVVLNYPERVKRIVFESASVITENTPAEQRDNTYFEDPFDSLPVSGEYNDGTMVWDDYMDWWYYNDQPVDEDFLKMAKYEASWLPLEAWRAIGGSLAEPQDLNEDIPAIVIYGEDDYLMNASVRETFKRNYGDSVKYICHEGMGHNLHWEDPSMISDEIIDFFNSTKAAEVIVDNSYPVAEKVSPPIAPTGVDPSEYYNADGKLVKQLDSIAQGDWVNFKHYVELESGIKMAYIEMGNPNGTPLMLLHGMTDSSRSWSSIVPYLVKEYHLYIPDQRGHGDTDKPDMKKYDRSLFAYDLSCFMDEMGLTKVSIMGHSMGSMNAQAFAMDYPDKVDKLILESTIMIGSNSATDAGSFSEYDMESPANAGKTWSEIVTWDPFIQWWYYNTIPVPKVFHQMVMSDCYNYPPENWTFLFPASYQARILANHNIDTLVLHGSLDYLMGSATQDKVKSQMSQAYDGKTATYEYKEYTGYGHNIHWEIPETIATDVKAFLNK